MDFLSVKECEPWIEVTLHDFSPTNYPRIFEDCLCYTFVCPKYSSHCWSNSVKAHCRQSCNVMRLLTGLYKTQCLHIVLIVGPRAVVPSEGLVDTVCLYSSACIVITIILHGHCLSNKLCGRPPQYVPPSAS